MMVKPHLVRKKYPDLPLKVALDQVQLFLFLQPKSGYLGIFRHYVNKLYGYFELN